MALIRIELQSNLCIGSGYSYAGIVDSDVCYDKVGLPYIPARRIKGVLRDAARIVYNTAEKEEDDECIKLMFGESGADSTKGIRFSDAYIDNYKTIYRELRDLQDSSDEKYTAQDVLEQYTTIVAQTKINKEGVAEDNTLRYIRVVNQYNPTSAEGDNLVFFAKVDGIDENESYEEILSKTCKAVRHMGLNRNRGLGNVKVSLEQDKQSASNNDEIALNGAGKVTIRYTLRNEQPLLLSSENDSATMPYIKGQMIQGALAGNYLRKNKVDDTFEKLFVSGDVVFSNAYPSNNSASKIYKPAPLCMGQYKEAGEENPADYATRINAKPNKKNLYPKPLRDKFISLVYNDEVAKLEVEKYAPVYEVVYHNRRKQIDMDRLLYMSEVLSPGQYFTGTITGDADLIQEIMKLMCEQDIRLGKSKSAQYGKCTLENDGSNKVFKVIKTENQDITTEDKLVVVLESDSVFENETGYVTDVEEVALMIKNQIEQVVGKTFLEIAKTKDVVDDASEISEDMNRPLILATGKKQTGYYGVWNMRKAPKPAITAGSSFVFNVLENVSVPTSMWVGVDNKEGYGQLKIATESYYSKYVQDRDKVDTAVASDNVENKVNTNINSCSEDVKAIMEKIRIKYLSEKLHEKASRDASKMSTVGDATNSFIGRVKLMLLESEYDSKELVANKEENFKKRVNSIRDKSKRKIANVWIEDIDVELKKEEYASLKDETKHKLKYDYLMHIFETLKYRAAIKKEENK